MPLVQHASRRPNNLFRRIQVSAPIARGWFSPEEAAAALTSPSGEAAASASPPSSPPEPLPPSAVDVVLTLMRCNPCEVLGSLSPGIGVDGRISLIGHGNVSGPGQTVGTTEGGKDKNDGVGRGAGESLLRERHRRQEEVGGGCKGFRCFVEVAWDKDEGGVFVQRFGMEPDERRPRWVQCRQKRRTPLWMCSPRSTLSRRVGQELRPTLFWCLCSPTLNTGANTPRLHHH